MAARGTVAKEVVEKKIAAAFGEDFIGIFDKKIYVKANDGGEKVQIAISLTCPKVPVGGDDGKIDFTREPGDSLDFEHMSAAAASPTKFEPAEITDEERSTIADLISKLGL